MPCTALADLEGWQTRRASGRGSVFSQSNAGEGGVLMPGEGCSQADAAVLLYARQANCVLLTRNVRDFLVLHQADTQHAGILAEHQDADPAKNMAYRQIAAAIGKLEASGWALSGEFVSLNAWR